MVYYLQRHVDQYFDEQPFVNAISSEQRVYAVLRRRLRRAARRWRADLRHRSPADLRREAAERAAPASPAGAAVDHQPVQLRFGTGMVTGMADRAPDPVIRYVTLAYGDAPGVYRQSLMLLVSLVAHAPEPYELVVATDRPECYVWFGTRVEIEYLDRARLDGVARHATRSRCARSSSCCAAAWPRPARRDRPARRRRPRAAAPRHRSSAASGAAISSCTSRNTCSAERAARGNRELWNALRRLHASARGQISAEDAMWNSGVLGAPGARIDRCRSRRCSCTTHWAPPGSVISRPSSSSRGSSSAAPAGFEPRTQWFTHYWGNKAGYDAEIARRLADAFIEGMSVKEAAARYRDARRSIFRAEVPPARASQRNLRRWTGQVRLS